MTGAPKPHVAVNGAILKRGISGSAAATKQILAALAAQQAWKVDTVFPPWTRRSRWAAVNASRDTWWDLRGAGRAAGRAKVLISPCNVGQAPKGMAHVLVVYDVMVFENPQFFEPKYAYYFGHLVPYSVRRAERIVTISDHARDFLASLAPNADIRVLRLPGRDAEHSVAQPAERRYVLMVGATEPHKNHMSGIEAVADMRNATGEDIGLLLIGPRGRSEPLVQAHIDRFDPSSSWIARKVDLSDNEVDAAYGAAWLLLQPSHNEGYGLPLVEAAQRGLPVVHSGRGAMSEILPMCGCGGPQRDLLTDGMTKLLDPDEWQHQSRAVLSQSLRFTWNRFQSQLIDHLSGLAL